MKKIYANGMLASALLCGVLTLTAVASEMDPALVGTSAKSSSNTAIQVASQEQPNVIVVAVDENGKETYYAGKTTVAKETIERDKSSAEKAVAEIVTDKNQITNPGNISKDEMDQTTSTPQWFYVGFSGLGVGIGWAPCNYWYSYTYYPAYAPCYRPCLPPPGHRPYGHGPRRHYRFYWC